MTQGLRSIVPTIALIAVLAMAPVAPEAGNMLFLVAGALGFSLMWPEAIVQVRRPIVWMPLAGLVLVATAYGISAGANGLVGLLYFAPLLAIWPLVTLLQSSGRPQLALLSGVLALCGASGAAIMAMFEVQSTGTTRAGGLVANPIHFADVALLVGSTALIGALVVKARWRFMFGLAPVMALIAVLLSGTRGAVVAVVAMLAIAVVTAVLHRLFSLRLMLALGVCLIVVVAGFLVLGGAQISGVQRVLADIAATLSSGAPTDGSTALRLQMYLGGFRAFLEAPIVGHGPLAFTAVADGLADTSFGGAPHLHNDLADMAASAGLFGVGAYILFLLAPVVEIIRSPEKPGKRANVVLIATLVAGFFTMGLTNAMFGILTVTVTFAAICAITGLLAAPE
ncbi:O-antigen ligase family protein [Devosia salina]|nr:O-antigen ligase family protein [Devosia salina]